MTMSSCLDIPGFHADAEKKKMIDNNLPPLKTLRNRPFQYGDSSLTAISTDDPYWSPGECRNLWLYEGRFLADNRKISKKVMEN